MPWVGFTTNELLVLLIEECSETQKAATKCLRFGFDHDEPGYGTNSITLAKEIGDILGVVEALPLVESFIKKNKQTKMERAAKAKMLRPKPTLYIVTRDVTTEECHWINSDIKAGTILYRYTNYTYGCVSDNGMAMSVTGGDPFFEVPRDALQELNL